MAVEDDLAISQDPGGPLSDASVVDDAARDGAAIGKFEDLFDVCGSKSRLFLLGVGELVENRGNILPAGLVRVRVGVRIRGLGLEG